MRIACHALSRALGCLLPVLIGLTLGGLRGWGSGPSAPASGRPDRGYAYVRDTVPAVPWSIHIFKVSRARRDLAFTTTLGRGHQLGMATVSEQMRRFPAALGTPLAAVNGDFYVSEPEPMGDPRDLQIRDGELISAPTGHACFWLDAAGTPQSTNVQSRFRAVWPDGSSTPFGLNELREPDAAVLYSQAVGPNAWSRDGTDLILERNSAGDWLPLRAGHEITARVREVRSGGGTPVGPDVLVLSLGPKLSGIAKLAQPGTVVRLIPETLPDLSGVTTAIGGGPTLVRNGRPMEWSGFLLRHPRTAVGWNDEHLFLVEVDGRQGDLSVGMTFPELAEYLVKLGCREAINLDGGGSATMWALGQIVNSPSEGQERPGANSLVVYLRRPPPAESGHSP